MTKTKKEVPDTAIDLAEEEHTEDRHEVQEWFDRWADQLGFRLPEFFGNRLPEFWGANRELAGVMRIEETVDENGVTIRGEIPGIDPEKDLNITVEGNRVNISAERRQREERTEEGTFHTEFRYGSYRRSFPLPASASADDIQASYDDGILEISVPVQMDREGLTKIAVKKRGG